MSKYIAIWVLCMSLLQLSYSQSTKTLVFNQTKIITNALETVPVGKTWKITSIYGSDRICVPCITNEHMTGTSVCNGRYVDYVGASYKVNGVTIFSERDWEQEGITYIGLYSDAACTNVYSTGYGVSGYAGWGYYDIKPNPNILPMWLPAGSTLQAGSTNIFLSVIEFDIVP